MPRLLIIDDEPIILHAFRRAFEDPDTEVITAETATDGERLVKEMSPDVIVLDLNLPDRSGLECFERIKAIDRRIPVIFITGHGTVASAIEATKLGAFDYLFKPLELPELQGLISRALRLSEMSRHAPVVNPDSSIDSGCQDAMIGHCEFMQEVYKAIGRVAAIEMTVLIQGESGTGKELVARAVYQHSLRNKGPFRALNCAAITETLQESELFGHEKGAFTGADRQRIGYFEQAHQGTLFLDEVGDMSPATQAKLLRILQTRTFERVGGSAPVTVDVRVIAATNHDLEECVKQGTFRADLFFRLSEFVIKLPPLRDRTGDVPLLAQHFIQKHGRTLGSAVTQISDAAVDLLSMHSWPGNVRELESVIKQSLLNSTGTILLPEFLPGQLGNTPAAGSAPPLALAEFVSEQLTNGSTSLYADTIARAERDLIRMVLQHTGGHQMKAAGILGISRVTLRSKIRSLEIDPAGAAE